MVNGVAQLRAKFARVPDLVKDELVAALEKSARELVSEMNAIKPIPEITIGWTWGDVPKGALKIGEFRGNDYGRLSIKVYAEAHTSEYMTETGFPAVARWFEFGTAERFHKSGKSTGRITARPYFYPTMRANKSRIKGRITRAVNKGMKRANG
jgi:hypothetical protein